MPPTVTYQQQQDSGPEDHRGGVHLKYLEQEDPNTTDIATASLGIDKRKGFAATPHPPEPLDPVYADPPVEAILKETPPLKVVYWIVQTKSD